MENFIRNINSNLSGGSAAGQCVLGAFVIVTSRTRSVRYCGKNMLDIKRFSLPSTIMMRNDKRRLAHAMRLFALRFKLEFAAKKVLPGQHLLRSNYQTAGSWIL